MTFLFIYFFFKKTNKGRVVYITGDVVINLLSHVFSFNGWNSHTEELTTEIKKNEDETYMISTTATVIIRLKDGTTRSGVGHGSQKNVDKDKYGDVKEQVEKTAETDALKRAAHLLGPLFSCVYNENYQKYIYEIFDNGSSELFKDEQLFRNDRVPAVGISGKPLFKNIQYTNNNNDNNNIQRSGVFSKNMQTVRVSSKRVKSIKIEDTNGGAL